MKTILFIIILIISGCSKQEPVKDKSETRVTSMSIQDSSIYVLVAGSNERGLIHIGFYNNFCDTLYFNNIDSTLIVLPPNSYKYTWLQKFKP